MSSRSPRLRSGRITSVRPAAWAASDLLLEPADRQHPTLEGDLAGHPDGVLDRAAREQRGERRDHRDARAGAVLGDRSGRDVDVELLALEVRCSSMPSSLRVRRARRRARSAPTPSSRRPAARSARGRRLAALMAVASTNSTSPPVPVTARPVATPGTAVRTADSWKNFWRPSASRTASRSMLTGAVARAPRRSSVAVLRRQRAELALQVADARLAGVLG